VSSGVTLTSRTTLSLLVFAALLVAAVRTWKDKSPAEWTEDDAKEVLSDSPWVKTVTPIVNNSANNQSHSGGMSRGSYGGFGIPGMGGGMGRHGGMGGGGSPRSSQPQRTTAPPTLTLRWESAFPIREAELKARDNSAPTLDEDHYAIAVYGVPNNTSNGDTHKLEEQLKKQASIKRDGKKDFKPSSVQVTHGEEGLVVVYLFPRTTEITKDDRRLQFEATIGKLQFDETFFTEDMVYQGKREL